LVSEADPDTRDTEKMNVRSSKLFSILLLSLLGAASLWSAPDRARAQEAQKNEAAGAASAPADPSTSKSQPAEEAAAATSTSETATSESTEKAATSESTEKAATSESTPAEATSETATPGKSASGESAESTSKEAPSSETTSDKTAGSPTKTDEATPPGSSGADGATDTMPKPQPGAADSQAAPTQTAGPWYRQWYVTLAIVAAVLLLPFFVGNAIARRVRMPELAWKINLVLITITAGAVICASGSVKLGPDLSGGIKLIYELQDVGEREQDQDSGSMDKMTAAIHRRIDPSGVKEVTVRKYGPQQIEIIVPYVQPDELEGLKRLISTAGSLEFRITASEKTEKHRTVIDEARRSPSDVVKIGGKIRGRWVKLDEEQFKNPGSTDPYVIRTTPEGEREVLIIVDPYDVTGDDLSSARTSADDEGRPNVLFSFDSDGAIRFGRFTGENIPNAATGHAQHLGIVLDNVLISAPQLNSVITTNGEITGNFSQEEVEFLVNILRAGSLPRALAKQPLSVEVMSPTLGEDMIASGERAIGISVIAVLAFMLLYYRFSGLIACLALTVNLVLIMAVMISVKAAFTLPGLAGLVLTVGMAVDANVLIFERIREELNRGAALRMAIRNGFGRATTTIVDANVTTLITGVVLYAIGTDQIKGFAVTLILGILMSMYTAIFCSRIVFDMAERRHWIQTLRMSRIVGNTSFDFLGKRNIAVGSSLVVIVIGLVGVFGRGSHLLDIDFTGGTSVTILFKEGQKIHDIRQEVNSLPGLEDAAVVAIGEDQRQFNVNARTSGHTMVRVRFKSDNVPSPESVQREVNGVEGIKDAEVHPMPGHSAEFLISVPEGDPDTVIKQVTDLFGSKLAGPVVQYSELQHVQDRLHETFGNQLQTYTMNFAPPTRSSAADSERADDAATGSESAPDVRSGAHQTPVGINNDTGLYASPGPRMATGRQEAAGPLIRQVAYLQNDEAAAGDTIPANNKATSDVATAGEGTSTADLPAGGTQTKLTFGQPGATDAYSNQKISHDSLEERLKEMLADHGLEEVQFTLSNPEYRPGSSERFKEWDLYWTLDPQHTQELLSSLQQQIESAPIFPSSSNIGGAVAVDAQTAAAGAMFLSLLCIVGYIWIRFQRVMFGLAAVVALIHDVLVTLGALALSYYLVTYVEPAADVLLVDPFKISLPIVAAFLVIIGYSLNDTIVVFDRIREVRGKSPDLTPDMINASINQTLSRTLLTSLTTLIVVIILYILGGKAIHGFAFSLVVGIFVGTYSSIFIASPILIWMTGSGKRATAKVQRTS